MRPRVTVVPRLEVDDRIDTERCVFGGWEDLRSDEKPRDDLADLHLPAGGRDRRSFSHQANRNAARTLQWFVA